MSVKQVNDIEVKCPNNHAVLIPRDALNHEVVEIEDKSEHGMGKEVHHRYSVEGYRCPECNVEIDAFVDVWEYPDGVIETMDKSENVVSDVGGAFDAALD